MASMGRILYTLRIWNLLPKALYHFLRIFF